MGYLSCIRGVALYFVLQLDRVKIKIKICAGAGLARSVPVSFTLGKRNLDYNRIDAIGTSLPADRRGAPVCRGAIALYNVAA